MVAYYNEHDRFAAAWLRELIKAGHIAPGVVDERDIRDVLPDELAGFTQCHFFAGIGVWSYALRRAGWPDDRPVWTGSCPCQPFSAAGQRAGLADDRHLWPAWEWLISQSRPSVVFGEQVASKDGLAWLDIVLSDLEAAGYAAGAVDLCAAGVGAPHIRQRLWFVADSASKRLYGRSRHSEGQWTPKLNDGYDGYDGELANADGRNASTQWLQRGGQYRFESQDRVSVRSRLSRGGDNGGPELERPGPVNGFWRDSDWLFCRDGKWRPVEPGTSPLVNRTPARVGRLRGYGNAIIASQAEEIIAAYLAVRQREVATDACAQRW
jgi:DNA (cytosine-5)-methyltransferase 1